MEKEDRQTTQAMHLDGSTDKNPSPAERDRMCSIDPRLNCYKNCRLWSFLFYWRGTWGIFQWHMKCSQENGWVPGQLLLYGNPLWYQEMNGCKAGWKTHVPTLWNDTGASGNAYGYLRILLLEFNIGIYQVAWLYSKILQKCAHCFCHISPFVSFLTMNPAAESVFVC